MRLSCKIGNPDYNAAMLPAVVYLNGRAVQGCVHADEEAGTVECKARDVQGYLILDGRVIRTTVSHGLVRIEPVHGR
jgi:hypothetical protein